MEDVRRSLRRPRRSIRIVRERIVAMDFTTANMPEIPNFSLRLQMLNREMGNQVKDKSNGMSTKRKRKDTNIPDASNPTLVPPNPILRNT